MIIRPQPRPRSNTFLSKRESRCHIAKALRGRMLYVSRECDVYVSQAGVKCVDIAERDQVT